MAVRDMMVNGKPCPSLKAVLRDCDGNVKICMVGVGRDSQGMVYVPDHIEDGDRYYELMDMMAEPLNYVEPGPPNEGEDDGTVRGSRGSPGGTPEDDPRPTG